MKKTFFVLSLIIVMMISFIGCQKEEQQFAAKIIGLSGSVPDLEANIETEKQYDVPYYDETQPQEYKLTVHGETYTGTYRSSVLLMGTLEVRHYYKTEDRIKFDVESDGTLARITWEPINVLPSDVIELSEDELILQARNLVSDYLQINVDEYVPTYEFVKNTRIHEITLTKYLSGIETFDSVTVQIFMNGTPFSINTAMLGKLPSEVDRTFDLEAARSAVEKRCDELTAEVRDYYDTIEYKNWRFQLTIDEEGRFVLLTTVMIECSIDYEDSRFTYHKMVEFIQFI